MLSLPHQIALEFSDAGEDGHDHLSGMSGRVGPWLGDGLEACAGLADCLHDFEQVAGGPGKPIKPPNDQGVPSRSWSSMRFSSGRSRWVPETFSRKMRLQPALLRASS